MAISRKTAFHVSDILQRWQDVNKIPDKEMVTLFRQLSEVESSESFRISIQMLLRTYAEKPYGI